MSELCGSEWYLNKAAIGKKNRAVLLNREKKTNTEPKFVARMMG